MMTYIIAPTTTNSLFAILEYPELRFLISDKIRHSVNSSEYSSIGVGLYETLTDAVGMGRMWSRIGINYKDILGCLQSVQSIGESITSSKVMNQLQDIRKVVLPLNTFLGVLDLLMNGYTEEFCNLELVVSTPLQKDFDSLMELCYSNRVVASRMGLSKLEGATTPLMKNGINIIDDEMYESIGEFLLRSENHQLWVKLLSKYVGALEYSSLQCINVREFSKAVLNEKKSAVRVMVKFYLAANGYATLFRNGVQQ